MALTTDNAFRWQFSAMTGAEISPDLCGKSSDTIKWVHLISSRVQRNFREGLISSPFSQAHFGFTCTMTT